MPRGKRRGKATSSVISKPTVEQVNNNHVLDKSSNNGVSTLTNIIDTATPEVQELLTDECEIILECRLCSTMFREIPDFLCHKQKFCKVLHNPATHPQVGPLQQCAENLHQFKFFHPSAYSSEVSFPHQGANTNIKPSRIGFESGQETSDESEDNRPLQPIIPNVSLSNTPNELAQILYNHSQKNQLSPSKRTESKPIEMDISDSNVPGSSFTQLNSSDAQEGLAVLPHLPLF